MSSTAAQPWFREPMAWLVFSLPAAVVVAGVATAVIAVRGADGPVADDTYRAGLAIGEQMARSERAAALGVVAAIEGGAHDGDAVRVRVTAAQPLPDEPRLELRWVHPGRRAADRSAQLVRVAASDDGRRAEYSGRVSAGAPSADDTPWRIVLAAPSWRLDSDAGAHPLRAHR